MDNDIRQLTPVWLVALVGAAGLSLLLVFFIASPVPAAPTIAWTPSAVTETVLAGETKNVQVSFTSSENLGNVVVRVVPELEPFVQVNPLVFGSVTKGQILDLNIRISVPGSSLPDTIQGTIQLRNESDPGNVFARPLPVTINITWAVYANDQMGYSLTYPPTFVPANSTDDASGEVGFYESQQAYSQGIGPLFIVKIHTLATGVSLRDLIQSFGVPDQDIVEVFVGNRLFLRWIEPIGEATNPVSYSSLLNGNRVITLTSLSSTFATSSQFMEIMSSFVTY